MHVDDMLIVSRTKIAVNDLKARLSYELDIKDLIEALKILIMEIIRDRRKGMVSLTQKAYLQKVL